MTDTTSKTPRHLWVVGVIAVLFNAIGAFDFVMSMTDGAAYVAGAGMTPEQIAHYLDMPAWMTAVWATGVWSAFIASILLLFRKRAAFGLFALSLAAFLISLLYTYVLTNGGAVMGGSMAMAIASAVITAELVFLTWYSRAMTTRGVLR